LIQLLLAIKNSGVDIDKIYNKFVLKKEEADKETDISDDSMMKDH